MGQIVFATDHIFDIPVGMVLKCHFFLIARRDTKANIVIAPIFYMKRISLRNEMVQNGTFWIDIGTSSFRPISQLPFMYFVD